MAQSFPVNTGSPKEIGAVGRLVGITAEAERQDIDTQYSQSQQLSQQLTSTQADVNTKQSALPPAPTDTYLRGDQNFEPFAPAVRAALSATAPIAIDPDTGVISTTFKAAVATVPPGDIVTIAGWLDVTIGATVYKVPYYV